MRQPSRWLLECGAAPALNRIRRHIWTAEKGTTRQVVPFSCVRNEGRYGVGVRMSSQTRTRELLDCYSKFIHIPYWVRKLAVFDDFTGFYAPTYSIHTGRLMNNLGQVVHYYFQSSPRSVGESRDA